MYNRSLARELSLLSLGLIDDKGDLELNKLQIEEIFESALDTLINHFRDELDDCESDLEDVFCDECGNQTFEPVFLL